MKCILDFKTSTTIDQHLIEMMDWLEEVRLYYKLGYTRIQTISKEISPTQTGTNLCVCIKKHYMETNALTILSHPCLLNFEFEITNQDGIVITGSYHNTWVKMFLSHVIRMGEVNYKNMSQFAQELEVSCSLINRWKTADNITLKYLFKCLKFFGYRIIFKLK